MNKKLLYVIGTLFFVAYFNCHAVGQDSTSLTPYEKTVYYTLVDLYNSGQLKNMAFDERLNVEDLHRILNISKEECRAELSKEIRNKAAYAIANVLCGGLSLLFYTAYSMMRALPEEVLYTTKKDRKNKWMMEKLVVPYFCFTSCGFLYNVYALNRYCGYVGDEKQELLTIDEIKEELDQLLLLKMNKDKKIVERNTYE